MISDNLWYHDCNCRTYPVEVHISDQLRPFTSVSRSLSSILEIPQPYTKQELCIYIYIFSRPALDIVQQIQLSNSLIYILVTTLDRYLQYWRYHSPTLNKNYVYIYIFSRHAIDSVQQIQCQWLFPKNLCVLEILCLTITHFPWSIYFCNATRKRKAW